MGGPNVFSFGLLEYIKCARTSVYIMDVSFEEIGISMCTNLLHHYIQNCGILLQLQAVPCQVSQLLRVRSTSTAQAGTSQILFCIHGLGVSLGEKSDCDTGC